MARDMMLTMDEYLAIRRLIESERESEGAVEETRAVKRPRRVSNYQREFGRQLRELESTSRKKDGSYRAGFTRSKVMNKAHKLTRKALNMR
jgi:hypothetical protein